VSYQNADTDPRTAEFCRELQLLCEKHRISIEHEDGHGAFILLVDSPDPTGIGGTCSIRRDEGGQS